EGDDADALGVHAWPVLQEFEGLHYGLAVARRDLVVKERGGPDGDDDDAFARQGLRQVDELWDRAVIASARHVDDGLAAAGDRRWRRGRLVDVQKDRANGRGDGETLEANGVASQGQRCGFR